MAFARIALFPGGTREQYDAVSHQLGDGATDQPERILLASGATEEGWQILQIWESQKGLERFVEDHLRPAMGRVGDQGFQSAPTITDFELADLYI
jgi:hypothetical protein